MKLELLTQLVSIVEKERSRLNQYLDRLEESSPNTAKQVKQQIRDCGSILAALNKDFSSNK